jgi:hypothetical protein
LETDCYSPWVTRDARGAPRNQRQYVCDVQSQDFSAKNCVLNKFTVWSVWNCAASETNPAYMVPIYYLFAHHSFVRSPSRLPLNALVSRPPLSRKLMKASSCPPVSNPHRKCRWNLPKHSSAPAKERSLVCHVLLPCAPESILTVRDASLFVLNFLSCGRMKSFYFNNISLRSGRSWRRF